MQRGGISGPILLPEIPLLFKRSLPFKSKGPLFQKMGKNPKASAGNGDQARIAATAKGRISSNVMNIINPIQ